MDSALRPRDIQARIRAGESPETVATAAQTTVEAIMPFAGPVLAEREHVAQTAQKASVRRSGEAAPVGRTLGEAAAMHLTEHSLHAEDVEWDSWKRPDGRWTLVATYSADGRARRAEFTHDLPGRFVLAENDDARVLTGELSPTGNARPAGVARPQPARRLTALPGQDELPLGDDAIELVRDRTEATEEPAAADPIADTADADWIGATVEPEAPDDGPDDDHDDRPDDHEDTAPVEVVESDEPDEPPATRKKGRASVPSWDEIMFGGGKGE